MANGLSPYLTGNFPEPTETDQLTQIMQQMGINAAPPKVQQAILQTVAPQVKRAPPQDIEMPVSTPQAPVPQAQAIEAVKSQLVQNLPAPSPTKVPVPPQALEMAKRNDWEENTKRSLAEQDAGLESLENYISEYSKQPRGIDFSPLAAWIDSMMPGSKLTPVAQSMAPQSLDARQEKFIKLQDLLQQRRQNLSQNALAPYKAQLDAYKDMMRLQAQDQGRQGRFDTSQDVKMFDKARKEQAGFAKDATDFVNSYRNVENAITPDNDGTVSVGRVTQSLSQFARLMGEKGVLTDTDTGRQLANTLELQLGKMQAILGSNPNARIPASNIAAMTEALGAAKQAYKESYTSKADVFRNTYFDNPGSPYAGKEWAPMLVEELYKPLQLVDAPPVGGGSAPRASNPARSRLEELRKKAGK